MNQSLTAYLGAPRFEMRKIFDQQRFPNLVAAGDGSVLATWGRDEMGVRRSIDGGASWEPAVTVGPGVHGGGATVDESTGDVLVFTHPEHAADEQSERFAERTMHRSQDHGRTWQADDADFKRDARGHLPSLHFAEHGITLRHGPRAGRLLRPARVYGKADGYNTAIYSDDHGRTWHASAPFPVGGTGEGAVAELDDGRVYYSSRKHFFTDAERWRAERLGAWSDDGGETWSEAVYHAKLPDGPRYRGEERRAACWNGHFGMAAGLTRLPVPDRDVLLYSNADQPGHTRHRMTVWASFDGGATWPIKRLVDEGPAAYSSLIAGRAGTPSAGWAYLLFERWKETEPHRLGPGGEGHLARFNLAWLLQGEATGDGVAPRWLTPA